MPMVTYLDGWLRISAKTYWLMVAPIPLLLKISTHQNRLADDEPAA